jgi:hypothetical protein
MKRRSKDPFSARLSKPPRGYVRTHTTQASPSPLLHSFKNPSASSPSTPTTLPAERKPPPLLVEDGLEVRDAAEAALLPPSTLAPAPPPLHLPSTTSTSRTRHLTSPTTALSLLFLTSHFEHAASTLSVCRAWLAGSHGNPLIKRAHSAPRMRLSKAAWLQ